MKCEITLSGSSHATHVIECRSVKEAVDEFSSQEGGC